MHWEVALELSELFRFRWTIFVVLLGPFSLLQCLLFFDTFYPLEKTNLLTPLKMCCSSTQEDSLPSACLRGLARHFKTEPTETVALCFGYPKTPCLRAEGKLSSSVDEQHIFVYIWWRHATDRVYALFTLDNGTPLEVCTLYDVTVAVYIL
jgi:hypothetical protein